MAIKTEKERVCVYKWETSYRNERLRGTVTDPVLYVAITQFKTEQILKWFTQRLVEVEVRQF